MVLELCSHSRGDADSLREPYQAEPLVNRTPERAVELAAQFADLGPVAGGAYSLIGQRQFDLIINGTSGGLSGEMPDIPSSQDL